MDTNAALGHGLACPLWCNDGVARRFCVVDVSSRSSYLEIWYIFLYDLVFGVMCSVFGCSFCDTEHWILREMTWSLVALLSSTVDTYSVLYWAGSWKNFMIFFFIGYFAFLHVATLSLAGLPAPQLRSRRLPAGSGRSSSFSAVACSGGDWLILLVTMHFALCSLACRPFWVEEGVAALVVVSGSDMNGLAGIFAPRAMFPTIAGVPQIQEQIVDVVLHSTGGDQQHRVTDRGIQYPLLLACSHSANCAEDRRDPTGDVLGLDFGSLLGNDRCAAGCRCLCCCSSLTRRGRPCDLAGAGDSLVQFLDGRRHARWCASDRCLVQAASNC